MFLPNRLKNQAAKPRSHVMSQLGKEGRARVTSFMPLWGKNSPTPLVALPGLAKTIGVGAIHVMVVGLRMNMDSFKALGGAYAVMSLLKNEIERRIGRSISAGDILSPEFAPIAASMTVACATDGNHGRSVAAGAKLVGCRAVIFMHRGVTERRAAAISRFGAQVVRVDGDYDDSIAEATAVAGREGWMIVSDTSWEGYEDIPLAVMQGYTVMVGEALDALAEPPTHIFIQAGVGGVAAAVAAYCADVPGAKDAKIVVVEPARAACFFASAQAGKIVETPRGPATIMGMLECRIPSALAWEVLAPVTSGFITLDEQAAPEIMRQLAFPIPGDQPIVSGESGGVSLAGALAAMRDPDARAALGLDKSARILAFNTEGATDATLYKDIVGQSPEAIKSQQTG
jgi:diaminopropionate ammonia-lyase